MSNNTGGLSALIPAGQFGLPRPSICININFLFVSGKVQWQAESAIFHVSFAGWTKTSSWIRKAILCGYNTYCATDTAAGFYVWLLFIPVEIDVLRLFLLLSYFNGLGFFFHAEQMETPLKEA